MRLLIKVVVIYLISSCFILPLASADTEANRIVQDLLAKSSGVNIQQEREFYDSLLQHGPNAIKTLCQLLQPSGDDARQRTVLMGLAVYVNREGAENQRQLYCKVVCRSLKTIENKEIKVFLIELLQWAGKDECVETLSVFLTDERLCDPAVRALTEIGTNQAVDTLVGALAKQDTAKKQSIILSLGALRAEQAVGRIEPFLDSKDKALRQSAQWALATIGYEPLAGKLETEYKNAKGYEKGVVGGNYLLLARRLAEKGTTDKSVKMCRKLLAKSAVRAPANIQAGALETLVTAVGAEAMSDLLAAAASDDRQIQAAAVSLVNKIEGTEVTKKWADMLQKADPGLAVRILRMLAERGDPSAMSDVLQAMKHSDSRVVVEAINTAAKLSPAEAIKPILTMLQRAEQAEQIAAGVDVLMRFPGEEALSAVVDSFDMMPPAARVKLIEGLANRHAKQYSKSVMAQMVDDDKSVRRAAMKAMKDLAGADDLPALVERMLSAQAKAEKMTVQRAVVAAAMQISDSQKRADYLLEVLSKAKDSDRVILLRTVGYIGGQKAMAVVVKSVQDSNPDIKDAAIRALADWPDATALDALIQIIKSEELKYQVIALRSGLKIMQNSSLPDKRKIRFAKQAIEAVKRTEEKRLIVGWLGQIKSLEALEMAGAYLDDEALQAEAALAAAKIALPDKGENNGLGGYETAQILKKVAGSLKNEKLKQQVLQYIETLPKSASVKKPVPEGFVVAFNGKDLSGWKGVLLSPYDNPVKRAALDADKRAELQAKADENMRNHWSVQDGVLVFDGKGFSLSTDEDYQDFEMFVDWKIGPHGDSGVYLRGSPQVQIWDPADRPEGSGGLFNNKKNPSKPLVCADNPIGQWNTFYIKMVGQRVTVDLNDKRVVEDVVLENYWDRKQPIFPAGPIELQCHGHKIWFDNIFIRRIQSKTEDWTSLFNGKDLSGWVGDTKGYVVENGEIVCKPGGNLYTEEQYSDFVLRFDFKLTPGANNGLGIRTSRGVNAAYEGMELQILDDTAEEYAKLKPYQYHGSIYGVAPAKRGHLKPVGQWNHQEVIAKGNQIKVILNGTTIVNENIAKYIGKKTVDGKPHPGLGNKSGHIGFLGHGTKVAFRNIEIKGL